MEVERTGAAENDTADDSGEDFIGEFVTGSDGDGVGKISDDNAENVGDATRKPDSGDNMGGFHWTISSILVD